MLWTIELFSIFTAGWKLKRKKRKKDATLISETVQISTVWLKGLCQSEHSNIIKKTESEEHEFPHVPLARWEANWMKAFKSDCQKFDL